MNPFHSNLLCCVAGDCFTYLTANFVHFCRSFLLYAGDVLKLHGDDLHSMITGSLIDIAKAQLSHAERSAKSPQFQESKEVCTPLLALMMCPTYLALSNFYNFLVKEIYKSWLAHTPIGTVYSNNNKIQIIILYTLSIVQHMISMHIYNENIMYSKNNNNKASKNNVLV